MKVEYGLSDLLRAWQQLNIFSLAKIVPKQKSLWVFGAWKGERYSDNSKYLFEYVKANHPEITSLWITKNKLAYELVRQHGYQAAFFGSWRATWACMRASVAISCVDLNRDLPGYAISAKTKLIQLWHGLGPKAYKLRRMSEREKIAVEQMGFASRVINKLALIYGYILNHQWYNGIKWLPYKLMPSYDLVVTTSKMGVDKMNQVFGKRAKRVEILGYPRHDHLVNDGDQHGDANKRIKVLYAPTHRSESGACAIKQAEELKRALSEYPEIDLVVKFHDLTNPSEGAGLHILDEREIEQDIYTILPTIDVLITDYSSIYTDFLLLDRPIIFIPFDLADYRDNDQGFLLDYDRVTPGPKAKDWTEAIKLAASYRAWGNKYESERTQALELFHQVRDGKSCMRITRRLLELSDKVPDAIPN